HAPLHHRRQRGRTLSFSLSPEQEELRTSVRRFLAATSDSAAVRALMTSDDGVDPAVWTRMADQLGLQGLAIPEEFGGAGFGPVELGIVLEEMGRALLVSPYFATVALAGQALTACEDAEAQAAYLPGIAAGTATATLAVTEESGSWDLGDVATAATADGDGWRLSGTKMFVVDGHTAELLLVVARDAAGLGLYAVDAAAAGLTRTRLVTVDPTRRLARVVLDATPATRIGTGDATALLGHVLDLVVVALAAEQVGGAHRCLDMAVDYAKVRVQFGRPIGSFQAIKHKCADMLLEVESARSAAYYAGSVVEAGGAEAAGAAALAKSYCSEAFTHAAKENIQIHGGIGFTWEHDSHLYLKRAKSSELLFGSPATHRSRLADLVGI
ncbi:MAG: acyl-CoA dehydrogenase domain protein, partial [Frankiales bacterium]|nr:acyl-CoA dehydrogenase domain protein [Frankiales bacterium]